MVGWETLTPPDLERIFGLTGGVNHSLIPRPHGNGAGHLTILLHIHSVPASPTQDLLILISDQVQLEHKHSQE